MDNRFKEAHHQRIWTDMNIWKFAYVICHWKIQLKQWDTTMHWLEYTILKSLTMQCFGKMKRTELSIIAG